MYVKKLIEFFWNNGICKMPVIPSKYRYIFYKWAGMKIENSVIRENVIFDGTEIVLHKGVFINRECFINCREKVEIGEKTFIGFRTNIFTATHEIGDREMRAGKNIRKPVTIGKGCWIGGGE